MIPPPTPPVIPWLTREEYDALPVDEKALHHAALEYALFGNRNLEVRSNRGPVVDRYTGGRAIPWCAAFVAWCYRQAGVEVPDKIANSACNWLRLRHLTRPVSPRRGCVGGWCDSARWRGHVFFVAEVKQRFGLTWVRTYEGNSNEQGSREGNAIVSKWRRVTSNMRFVVIRV